MRGLKVGHSSDQENGTGVTVFLFEDGAVGSYCLCGQAPATHELAVLDPENTVEKLHGLAFAGGSAYGLFAAQGVMKYLTERGIGHPVPHGHVPIVPAASIYDLAFKRAVPPSAEQAYQACLSAIPNNFDTGPIGAGTGARVGKLVPSAKPMRGGIGTAQLSYQGHVQVLAYAIVNCVGDVRGTHGEIIAGAKDEQGIFVDCDRYVQGGETETALFSHTNTTLVAIMINASFTKSALKRLAKMAIAGMARAITPAFTPFDGDVLFCISLGGPSAPELAIGSLAAHATCLAIQASVRHNACVTT